MTGTRPSTVDVLIVIPLIPLAAFILITWRFPLAWLPLDKIPKGYLAAYVLYVSFAAWHFDFPRWFVLPILLVGAALATAAIYERFKKRKREGGGVGV